MSKQFMNTQDAPSAKQAEFFAQLMKDVILCLMQKFEAKANVKNADVTRLGALIDGKKAVGLTIKFSMTVYKCSEMFDKLIEEFKNTGLLPTFECQVTSSDSATCMGRSTKVYKQCVIEGDVLLSMFDADGEFVEQTIEGYAMDFDSPERYTDPEYM